MSEQNTPLMIDPDKFVEGLLNEMGFADKTDEQKQKLTDQINSQLNHVILNTISLNLEPEVITIVVDHFEEEKDPITLIRELVKRSPGCQIALIEALEKFKEETLEIYNKYAKNVQ